MRFPRSCGVLVHPTSFPAPYGIGDFGPEARAFIDFLSKTDQTVWQVLPLSPVGYGNSPYASYSAFAGNEYLISPDILHDKGLLTTDEIQESRIPVHTSTEYDRSYDLKDRLLHIASGRFYDQQKSRGEKQFNQFKKENGHWLDDYVLFTVLSKQYDRKSWNKWDPGTAQRDPAVLKKKRKEFETEIRHEIWLQFEFHNQWMELKKYANESGIRIIGDIPIFVDHNSADVWANPEYFAVDGHGNREIVAGVPPDYFSETGQLWGNPVYKWDILKKDGYQWWINRFHQMFHLFDAIRVDHFRGFESSWQVSATEETAVKGNWIKGPGKDLFVTIRKELGEVPIIAEDLGCITPEVNKLRDHFEFPGMKILQFAFGSDAGNSFLPHNYGQNSVVYTGTHDNDTTIGWYKTAPEKEQHFLRIYTRSDCSEPHWELIRLAMLSVSDQAIFPLQDYMNLDTDHRMNIPGTVGNNWEWRYTTTMLNRIDRDRIRDLIQLGNRKVRNSENG
jgi:4-alpha-glucanotransferase